MLQNGKSLVWAALLWMLALPSGARAESPTVLRIGTVAPPGSSWAKSLRLAAREVSERSGGKLRIQLVYSDLAGDESEVLRMVEEKKLEGAALTGVGLGKIQPAYLVQQLPMLFRDYRELDCFREKMSPRFDALLAEKGWVALAYSDVGFVYVFTRKPVKGPDDLEKLRMWGWDIDVIGRKMLSLVGVTTVKLPLSEVAPALEKGSLDGFYASAYGSLAFGWHRFAKHRLLQRLALVSGALVVPKTVLDGLPEGLRETLVSVAKKWGSPIGEAIRGQNKRSREVMDKDGVQPIRLSAGENTLWMTIAQRVHEHFSDKLFPRALLDEVKKTIGACRASLEAKGD